MGAPRSLRETSLLLKLTLELTHPVRGQGRMPEAPRQPPLAAPEPPPNHPRVSPQSTPP